MIKRVVVIASFVLGLALLAGVALRHTKGSASAPSKTPVHTLQPRTLAYIGPHRAIARPLPMMVGERPKPVHV